MIEQETNVKTQYLGTFFANLVIMGHGIVCGWPSPAFTLLQSEDTPLKNGPIDDNEASWVASIMCIGGFIGTLIGGWMCDKFGRKVSVCFSAIPQIISWLIIIFGTNIYYLYISRVVSGIAGGACFVAVPIYVAEIAETRNRGFLGSMLIFGANAGIFTAYVGGAYLNYYLAPALYITLPVILLIGFFFLPETPSHLARMNRHAEAEESLRFYRGLPKQSTDSKVILDELAILKGSSLETENTVKSKDKITLNDFASRHAKRAIVLGIFLVLLNQFCGCFAMLNYTATIFETAGSSLSPNDSAIIVGFIQIFGSVFSVILVDRAGRKFCIVASAIGISIGLTALAVYTHLDVMKVDVSQYKWVPLAAFSFTIFIGSWGVVTLPFLIISEIMPEKIRAFSGTLCMCVLFIMSFVAIKILPTMILLLGLHGTMYTFAAFSLVGATTLFIIQPETKGKTFAEISEILGK